MLCPYQQYQLVTHSSSGLPLPFLPVSALPFRLVVRQIWFLFSPSPFWFGKSLRQPNVLWILHLAHPLLLVLLVKESGSLPDSSCPSLNSTSLSVSFPDSSRSGFRSPGTLRCSHAKMSHQVDRDLKHGLPHSYLTSILDQICWATLSPP